MQISVYKVFPLNKKYALLITMIIINVQLKGLIESMHKIIETHNLLIFVWTNE